MAPVAGEGGRVIQSAGITIAGLMGLVALLYMWTGRTDEATVVALVGIITALTSKR